MSCEYNAKNSVDIEHHITLSSFAFLTYSDREHADNFGMATEQ